MSFALAAHFSMDKFGQLGSRASIDRGPRLAYPSIFPIGEQTVGLKNFDKTASKGASEALQMPDRHFLGGGFWSKFGAVFDRTGTGRCGRVAGKLN